MAVKIKSMMELDRPRERLIKYGVKSLSDSELLSILINTGNNKNSAKDLANIVLKKCNGIKNLPSLNYEQLTKIEGIKSGKSCAILACLEISRRMNSKINNLDKVKITNCDLVYEYYKSVLESEEQEYFYCLYLDSNKKVICDKELFKGTLNFSLVHPREIFKQAYLCSAHAIICVHNHPSGNTNPSTQDIELTKNLVSLGDLHGIKVLDHIIIGKNNYFSFLENNLITL